MENVKSNYTNVYHFRSITANLKAYFQGETNLIPLKSSYSNGREGATEILNKVKLGRSSSGKAALNLIHSYLILLFLQRL